MLSIIHRHWEGEGTLLPPSQEKQQYFLKRGKDSKPWGGLDKDVRGPVGFLNRKLQYWAFALKSRGNYEYMLPSRKLCLWAYFGASFPVQKQLALSATSYNFNFLKGKMVWLCFCGFFGRELAGKFSFKPDLNLANLVLGFQARAELVLRPRAEDLLYNKSYKVKKKSSRSSYIRWQSHSAYPSEAQGKCTELPTPHSAQSCWHVLRCEMSCFKIYQIHIHSLRCKYQ